MVGRIEHKIAVLEGNAIETGTALVLARARVMEVFDAFVQIERDRVIVRNAIFDLFTKFPAIIALLPDGAVASSPEREPLFEFQAALGHGLRFVSISEEALGGGRREKAEREPERG